VLNILDEVLWTRFFFQQPSKRLSEFAARYQPLSVANSRVRLHGELALMFTSTVCRQHSQVEWIFEYCEIRSRNVNACLPTLLCA